jgi:ankyrin repeat protein
MMGHTPPETAVRVRRAGAVLITAVLLVGARFAEPLPLLDAAKGRDWETVRQLIDRGADVNATAPDGATALHWASYWDALDAAEMLLRAGADASATNDMGATPLWNASMNGSAAMVRVLLEAGADPNATLLAGESLVMTAARTGNPEVLELLLAAGADPNVRATRGQTALMWAASQRHPEAVRVLLRHGADVSARSDTWSQVMAVPPHADPANQQDVPHGGNTALLFAARVGDLASARLLVEAGSDIDAVDAWGASATVLAAHSGFDELLELLLAAGADPNLAQVGFSPLHLAILRRDEGMARTLLAHGADPNARITNWTPTRRASNDWSIHPSLVGATPFWLAARLAQPGAMRLLAEHGADPRFVHEVTYVGAAGSFGSATMTEANTAVMAAAGMGGPRRLGGFVDPDRAEMEALSLAAVKVAVELGVDSGAVDLEGWTAADRSPYPSVRAYLETLSAER